MLASGRGGRKENVTIGKTLFEAVNKGLGGENFADGDGVNPDRGRSGIIVGQRLRKMSHALAEADEIFAAAESLQGEIRREEHHDDGHQHTVKKIHVGSKAPVEKKVPGAREAL